jgi:glycerate-2-kinase
VLAANDAYTFWKSIGGLVRTGPTGTNVMDIIVALAAPDGAS